MASFGHNIALFFVLQIFCTDAARILAVYPMPSISHQVVFRSITEALIKRGHEVVVVTTDPIYPKGQAPANLTEIDVHDLSYSMWREGVAKISMDNGNQISPMKEMQKIFFQVLDKQLQVKEIQELIKGKEKFDLLLVEACIRMTLGFSNVYKVPVIQISSFGAAIGNYEAFGAPTHMLLYPDALRKRLYNLTMIEKLQELYFTYSMRQMFADTVESEDALIKKHFGQDTPEASELQKNVDMLFLNVNPIWEGNHPVPPNVIHMGGLPQRPKKPLPTELESYLNASKHGVIYISFGTNVQPSSLPPEKVQMLIKAVSKLPYDVLWKWDNDDLPGKSANIRLSKWLPQSDLLRHPKLKLFVTQGGLQSTDEAISAGVPLVVIPILGDQWYNAEKYVHHGIGIQQDIQKLTEESFSNAIKTVIGDESYRNNIIRLRTQMSDQPQQPLERAIWWIEYVLRHGGAKQLRSAAAHITWTEYLELELVAVVLSVMLSIILVIIAIIYKLYRLIKGSNSIPINAKVKRN